MSISNKLILITLIKMVKQSSNNISNKNFGIVSVESKIINKEIDKIISGTQNLKVEGFPTIGSITYDNNKNPNLFVTILFIFISIITIFIALGAFFLTLENNFIWEGG